jgi:UDPglucose 6-dehydrogenase
MNEFANLCERAGADISDVRRGVGFDQRIGHHFLFPGVGYGGSCFPKDVKALVQTANDCGFEAKVLKAVEAVNEHQKMVLVEKIVSHFSAKTAKKEKASNPSLAGRTIAVWGLSFKPRTDDMREAPSVVIISNLLRAGAEVKAHDPVAMDQARKSSKQDPLMEDLIRGAHAPMHSPW